jgi:hypothetical protein
MAIKVTLTMKVQTPSNVSDETYATLVGAHYVTNEVTIEDLLLDATEVYAKFEVHDG